MLRISLLEDGNAWPSTIQLINDLADTIEAQAAEIKRLREALRGMIDYSCYSERWQDDHPEYVAAALAALGETE